MPGITLQDTAMRSLLTAMSGLSTRQNVINNNLANIDTPGFKASRVSFAEELAQVTDTSPDLQLVSTNPAHLGQSDGSASPLITTDEATSQRLDGNNVDLEKEMASLSETVMHFQATSRIVSRKLSMLRTVIGGGGL